MINLNRRETDKEIDMNIERKPTTNTLTPEDIERKGNTHVDTSEGKTVVVLHVTDIVAINRRDNSITLSTGGWFTPTTKRRMNEVAEAYGLGFHVYQTKGEWYVDAPTFLNPNPIHFGSDSVTFDMNDDTYSASAN